MKRRALLARLGTTAVATTAFAGVAAADRSAPVLDREIDVSDVEGTVPLATVLDADELDELPDDLDPWEVHLTVDAETTAIDPAPTACDYMPLCCRDIDCPRTCNGCYCYKCES